MADPSPVRQVEPAEARRGLAQARRQRQVERALDPVHRGSAGAAVAQVVHGSLSPPVTPSGSTGGEGELEAPFRSPHRWHAAAKPVSCPKRVELPMAGATVHTWHSLPSEPGKGASSRQIAGEGASLKMVSIKAGTAAQRHSHPHEQFVHVLEGGGRLQCEIGTVPLEPGTVIHFAPNAWHSAVFEVDTVLVEVNLRPPG
jgi:quercetin dioxygenase-like cupin family protein